MENSVTLVDKNEFISEVESFIEKSVNAANSAVSSIVVVTYWNVGRMIVEEEQNGKSRAEYGKQIIQQLSERLTRKYGNNYSKRNLQYYRKFYQCFNDLEIVNTCVHNLNWSHFRRLLSVTSDDAKYMPYMPTQEELKNEIEKEKANFYIQHPELKIEERNL